MNKFLKYSRRVLGALIGGICLLYFIDILGVLPTSMHAIFHLQFVPALMNGMLGVLLFISLLTLFFGRVYCSVLCPLGVLQDFILRIKKWYLRIAKKRNSLRVKYKRPLNILRHTVLGVAFLPLAFGVSLPIMVLDPYSNFGRIATSLIEPMVMWGNNLLAEVFNSMGNYSLYNISEPGAQWHVTIFSAVVFVVLVVMVWRRGRLWCNTMCPVGTILGLISRFSLFRVSMSSDCNSCGLCSGDCKSHCIDPVAKSVDASRCVACFNCLSKCNKTGMRYAPTGWNCKKSVAQEEVMPATDAQRVNGIEDQTRRNFLMGAAVAIVAIPATALLGQQSQTDDENDYKPLKRRTKYPLPPGVIDRERFVAKCTACQLCVSKCPTNVLQPALFENGIEGVMQPYMNFKVECFCNYECKVCTEVCPTHAIMPITIEEKKLTRVGYAHFKRGHCVVFLNDQDCGACAEHCPSQAVHMVPYKDGLTIPQVDPELCIGCGGCESICPEMPPAIFVQGIDVQNQACKPTDDKNDVGEITDFGF